MPAPPNVTTIGLPPIPTKYPCITPLTTPTAKAANSETKKFPARSGDPKPVAIPIANVTPQIDAVSFNDNKKKFPDRVTNVSPIAIMPYSAASLIIALKLVIVK